MPRPEHLFQSKLTEKPTDNLPVHFSFVDKVENHNPTVDEFFKASQNDESSLTIKDYQSKKVSAFIYDKPISKCIKFYNSI